MYKSRFFTHVLTDTTKQENPLKRKSRISETTRPIKQNVNVSRAETGNSSYKMLERFYKALTTNLRWTDLRWASK